jgi:hypothetical protein
VPSLPPPNSQVRASTVGARTVHVRGLAVENSCANLGNQLGGQCVTTLSDPDADASGFQPTAATCDRIRGPSWWSQMRRATTTSPTGSSPKINGPRFMRNTLLLARRPGTLGLTMWSRDLGLVLAAVACLFLNYPVL